MPIKRTTKDFIRAAELIHGNKYDYSRVNYINSKTPVSIVCKEHGVFAKIPDKHLSGQGCTYYPCNASKKTEWRDELGFKLFKDRLFEIFGDTVKCISSKSSDRGKFLFECTKCNHTWTNNPSYQLTSKKNRAKPPSCKKCGGSEAISTSEKLKVLKALNITALNGEASIPNLTTKFSYQCKNTNCNYIGEKTLNNLKELKKNNLGYCDCTYKKVHWTLEKLIEAGEEGGYELLEIPKKVRGTQVFKWKCKAKGHIRLIGSHGLNHKCLDCFNDGRYTSFVDVENWLLNNAPTIELVANQRWTGSNSSYNFHCKVCNTTFSKYLKNLFEIPKCKNQSRSYGEMVSQFYLEELLKIKFVSNKKFSFLKNSKGNNMELDGYNEENRIAFEHQGEQHFEKNRYSPTEHDVERRKKDDALKKNQCMSNNIKLIEIRTLITKSPLSELKSQIKEELIRLNIDIPSDFDSIHPDLSKMKNYHKKRKV
jgi:hypothetical protein